VREDEPGAEQVDEPADEPADDATEPVDVDEPVDIDEADEADGEEPDEHRHRHLFPRLRRTGDGDHHDADDAESESVETVLQRFAHQWALVREERRGGPAPIETGPSRFDRAQVPWGLDLAASWAWRLLVIAGAAYLLLWLIRFFAVVTIPLAVALLVSALAWPLVHLLTRLRIRKSIAALIVVLGGLAAIGALLTFAGQQVATGFDDLADSTVQGLQEIRDWLRDGPVNASDSQINDWIASAQDTIRESSQDGETIGRVTEVGTAVGHVVAGFFITLFATYFFLADGERIWSWVVRLAPRVARERVDSSGRVAWLSLVQFVRATVIVAAVDAVGVMIGAAVLKLPFVLAIGVLVFLGAFVPLIGATIAGTVAVLVALVDKGPVEALIMLAVIIGVQQLEGHVLQPFLLGRWVALHPLGVILAIAGGVLVAGVVGALVAVPLAAAANAVVLHLAELAQMPVEEAAEELDDDVIHPPDEASHA